MNESIRDRYRYYKRKTTKNPQIERPPSTTIKLDLKHLEKTTEKTEYPNGAILYRKAFTDEFLERLALDCLTDFPFRDDTITNIEKLGREKLDRSMIDEFKENSILAKSKLKDLRWTTLGKKIDKYRFTDL